MGLFDFFKKKKELAPEQQSELLKIENFCLEFKDRYDFNEEWHDIKLEDDHVLLSFVGLEGHPDFALSLCHSDYSKRFDKNYDLFFDVSREGEKPAAECLQIVHNISRPIEFFDLKFEPKDIITEDTKTVPNLTAHGAGVTGIWLCLPIPGDAFELPQKFDDLVKWLVDYGKAVG